MHLPFQKVKKTIVWGRYIDCDNRRFFLSIGSSHLFTSRQSIYILQKRSRSHICLMWNVASFMTDEVRILGGWNAAKWGSWFLWQTAREGGSNFLWGM